MDIAYFINGYPKISHTFIRREIEAIEAQGAKVLRVALRPNPEELIDEADKREAKVTRYVLGQGWGSVIKTALLAALSRPAAALKLATTAIGLGLKSERGLVRHVAYALEALVLAKWCADARIKHIHAHFGTNSATVAMFAAQFLGITYSFTAHGADEIDQANSPDMRMKIARASFVAGVSWFVRSQLIRRMPHQDWDRIKVVHCGLGPDFLNAPIPPFPEKARFVCVGRLCVEKSQHLLVMAVARARAMGADIELVLAGDGPLRSAVEAVIAEHRLQNHVTITGWIDSRRVKAELAAARCLVLPSLLEGLPVAIMEAMALGRPVISTFVSGIPELVLPGETGWLVPAGDVEKLAQALYDAAQATPDQLATMGEAAKARVRERHSAATEAQKLFALFKPLA